MVSSSMEKISAALKSTDTKKDNLRKAFDSVKSHSSALATFTLQWSELEQHFDSLQKSLEQRFKELEAKEKQQFSSGHGEPASSAVRSELQSFCLKMDGVGLRSFIMDRRKDLPANREDVTFALQSAPDPAKLVLDALQGFYPLKSRKDKSGGELGAIRRTCVLMLEGLAEIDPQIKPQVKENAKKLARDWKQKVSTESDDQLEALVFLQLLGRYGIASEFNSDELLDLLVSISRRKQAVDMFKGLGFKDKLPEMSSGGSNSASVSSSVPSTTSLKRKSDDVAWQWGECRKPNNMNWITCLLCQKSFSGGVSRLKEHITQIRGNVTSCPNATMEIQKQINDQLAVARKKKVEKERIKQILTRQDEEEIEAEELEILEAEGGSTMPRQRAVSARAGANKRKVVDDVRGPMDQIFKVDTKKQVTLDKNNPHKQALKQRAWKKIAKWAYEVGLPFNAVRASSFTEMVHAIGDYGKAMPPPSYHNIRVTLLRDVYNDTKEFTNSFKKHWELYGCSIMSDFWTDGKQRALINFLVNCPRGTVFLKSIDASDKVKDATLIKGMIEEVIAEVGVNNIVSFVTDNGSNFKLAGRMLEEEHPSMFWTPCAAHCLNLMLHDLGEKLSDIKSAISEAKVVVGYIYNHGRVLSWLRKLTAGKELHRSCVTRFATSFYTLRSMYENRHHIQVLFVSGRWRKSNFASTEEGKRVERIVAKETFWNKVHFSCRVMAPLVDVLRLVDSEEKPCMGYIYEAMDRAKEQIEKNMGEDRRMCTRIWTIIDKRWDDQLHRPLHAAGFYLNPSIYYKQETSQIETNREIKSGLFKAMERLLPEEEIHQANIDLKHYRDADGTFGLKSAIMQRDKMQPHEWWLQYGSDTPSLTKFAIKVLSQTCSASPCERNWSAFDNLHSKKRNCLHQEKLNDLVFVQYNHKLEIRFRERSANPSSDPILLKDVDENDDWVIPNDDQLADLVREGDDLTWSQARAAMGADDMVGPSTRSTTQAPLSPLDDEDEDEDEEVNAAFEGTFGDDDDVDADDEDVDIDVGDD